MRSLAEARGLGWLLQNLRRAPKVGPHDADHGADGIGRRLARVHTEGVQIDGLFAGHDGAAKDDPVIGFREVVEMTQIVARQIDPCAAFVGMAGGSVAGRLDP